MRDLPDVATCATAVAGPGTRLTQEQLCNPEGEALLAGASRSVQKEARRQRTAGVRTLDSTPELLVTIKWRGRHPLNMPSRRASVEDAFAELCSAARGLGRRRESDWRFLNGRRIQPEIVTIVPEDGQLVELPGELDALLAVGRDGYGVLAIRTIGRHAIHPQIVKPVLVECLNQSPHAVAVAVLADFRLPFAGGVLGVEAARVFSREDTEGLVEPQIAQQVPVAVQETLPEIYGSRVAFREFEERVRIQPPLLLVLGIGHVGRGIKD